MTTLLLEPAPMLPTSVSYYFLFGKFRSAIQGFAEFGKHFPGIVALILLSSTFNAANACKVWHLATDASPVVLAAQAETAFNGPGEGVTKNDIYGWMALNVRSLNTNKLQESYIYLNPESTAGFDPQFDALYKQQDGPRFYSLSGGKAFFSNDIPSLTDQTEIQFIFVPDSGTDFELEAVGFEVLALPVFLYDKISRSDRDLSLNSTYSFNVLPGDDSARFVLHFGVTGMPQPSDPDKFNVFYSNQELHYTTQGSTDVLNVISMDGRVIRSIRTGTIGRQNSAISIENGVYIVQLVSGNQRYSKKIIIQ